MRYKEDYVPWLEHERKRLTLKYNKVEDENKVLREENNRLEKLNEALKFSESMLWRSSRDFELERDELEKENKALRLQANTYFDEWQKTKNLYSDLTQHIRQKAKNNPNVGRYIALVNFIKRLEGIDDEG